jgi:hypothetical protein
MPKRTSKPLNKRLETVQNASGVVLTSVNVAAPEETAHSAPSSPSLISQVMAEMGRKGGRIGGKRRLETMTDRQRSQIARKAAKARWSKKRTPD